MRTVPRLLERRLTEVKGLRCYFVSLLLLKMKRKTLELTAASANLLG